jgi:ABC-type polysaccharide/polyol phosphate export permease
MGIFIFSGWYYPPENMFVGLASLAYGNPLTYLALLLQSSGESEIAWDLVKATWMLALWYFGSSLIVWGYGNRLVRMVKRLPVK